MRCLWNGYWVVELLSFGQTKQLNNPNNPTTPRSHEHRTLHLQQIPRLAATSKMRCLKAGECARSDCRMTTSRGWLKGFIGAPCYVSTSPVRYTAE